MSKNWCITLNNYTQEEYERLCSYNHTYAILGLEVGKEGTPHIQGYMEFHSTKRLETLHNDFPRAHFEIRKGTGKQASDYCKKDNNYKEFGIIKTQGKRSDLITVANAVVDKTFKPIDFPEEYIKYHKGIKAFKESLTNDRTEPPYVEWRWGLSGVGKTRYCVETHKSHYIKDGTQWWDGYQQEQAIIIDDFDGAWPYRDLLRLLDRYKYQGQYKGGYCTINSPYIYITCEHPPNMFWSGNELEQILRRISKIVQVKKTDAPEVAPVVAGNTNCHLRSDWI